MTTVHTAADWLAAQDADLAAVIDRVGPSRLAVQTTRSPYEQLMRSVAYQQLHGRAAEAILGRVIALFPDHDFPPPALFLAEDGAALRACGLSAAKLAAMQDIAAKTAGGEVPDRAAALEMSDERLIAQLTALRGVGRWTVEMLLIFALGRPDVLPVDDFGVREGYRKMKRLSEQPKPRQLAEIGRAWSPHRSTAAWYLWRASEF